MKKVNAYLDYVICDGELIGEFEKMYQNTKDPWEQTTRETDVFEKVIGLELIKKYNHKRPLEYGCGFGDYTDRIFSLTGCAGGVDISETAINKAKYRHRGPDYFVGDLLDQDIINTFNPDCICMVEISWYVLEKLNEFKKILTNNKKGSGFFHTLMTYAPGEQKYGCDYFTNFDEIILYWSDIIEIKEYGLIGRSDYNGGHRTFLYGTIK